MKSAQSQSAKLRLEDVSWHPPSVKKRILHTTNFTLEPGRVLGVIGANGAGKTTLLRLIYRFQRPTTGTIKVDGEDIWKMSAKNTAQKVAAVLQEQPTEFALTVREIVALGRTPHRQGFASAGAQDAQIVDNALNKLSLEPLASRHFGTLSGGEKQRVMVARALAQEPHLLILDEPTNHLDIRHQLAVLKLIRDLPLTIVTSLHDLNMAARICDDVLLLKNGETIGFGSPQNVLSEINVSEAFQVHARREKLTPSHMDHLTFHLHNERT